MEEVRYTLHTTDAEPLALRISPGTQREKARLMELAASLTEDTLIVVDLASTPLNSSVLDELLCKEFLWRLRDPDGPLAHAVLANVHPHTEEELRLGARASAKTDIVFVARDTHGPRLVGLPTPETQRTFGALVAAGELTARELADRSGVPVNVAHNRLRQLHALRLACKSQAEPVPGGGRQHVYTAVR